MDKLKFILPLIMLSVMLGGCPYESKVPLEAPSVKINPLLLGTWEPKSTSTDKYVVKKLDDFTYTIEERKKENNEPKVYNAYLSELNGEYFLNLYEANSGTERKYYFYKVTLNKIGSKVALASVTENIDETFEKPEDLKAFFLKNKGLSFFFEKEEAVYIKED